MATALGKVKVFVDTGLYTGLYNNTRGNLWLTTIFHAAANTASGSNLSVLIIVIGLEILVAAVVTVMAGPARLSCSEPKQVQE